MVVIVARQRALEKPARIWIGLDTILDTKRLGFAIRSGLALSNFQKKTSVKWISPDLEKTESGHLTTDHLL